MSDIGPQLARAAAGDDPRGWLVFEYLPDDLQRAEDATAAADCDRYCARTFDRTATDTERALLSHLGFEVPEDLWTHVTFVTTSVRNRRWPALENTTLEVTQ